MITQLYSKRRLKGCVNLEDIRNLAASRVHKMAFDYIDGGSDDEKTLIANQADFDLYPLLHRVLVDVDKVDMSTRLLGHDISAPFITSPAAGNRLFHTAGELAVARAVGEINTIYTLSALSSTSIEDISLCSSGPKWFQLYVWKDRTLVKEMLDRAKAAGYSALMLTVDFAVTGNRERDLRNGLTIPPKIGYKQIWHALNAPLWCLDYLLTPGIRYANLSEDTPATSLNEFVADQLHAGFTWSDADWLLAEWNGPTVIKGVIHEADARRAIELGFNAIMISNHGGRQLDGALTPIRALERVRQSIGDDAEIILDGGIRRGTDIIKSIALGASAISFGRPYLYGLAAAGQAGVAWVLDFFQTSLKRDMALVGAPNIAALQDSDLIRPLH